MAFLFGDNQEKTPESVKLLYSDHNIIPSLAKGIKSFTEHLPTHREIVLVCVGTDRSTGDSLGPIVGSSLEKRSHTHFHVHGTLENPVHAMNLKETMDTISASYFRPFVIAVDACLGKLSSIGYIQIASGPVKPGAGVHKDLPPVGDIHLTGIVNVGGFMEYFVLQNTRLNLVMSMANVIADAIHLSLHQRNGTFVPSSSLPL